MKHPCLSIKQPSHDERRVDETTYKDQLVMVRACAPYSLPRPLLPYHFFIIDVGVEVEILKYFREPASLSGYAAVLI